MDINESCDCLDRPALLSMVDKVTLTGLVLRVPLEARAEPSAGGCYEQRFQLAYISN